MKNIKLLKTLEAEIYFYAITHSNRGLQGFMNRIFAYLRKNMELLQNTDYKKLYNECIILKKWLDRKELTDNTQDIYELVTDLMNKQEDFAYSKEIVEAYLKFRIDSWNTGYYDKLFE